MKRMVGFGDMMLRLSPDGYLRFSQADHMAVYYTGAEANVCASLAVMGMKTDFVTRLPDHDMARCAIGELRKLNVGTEHIVFGGERMGVFYLEKGASQRPSKVIYDRQHTAIATASAQDFDWDAIFAGADFFHFTGITPAISPTLPAVTLAACEAARRHGAAISCDLNYRKNLWSTRAAEETMRKLLPYVDILIANEEDAEKVLGIKAADTDVTTGKLSREGYRQVAEQIVQQFPNIQSVGITLRQSLSASDNRWGAMLYTGGQAYFSKTYDVHIVDRVGGGDSFAAGLLYARAQEFDPLKAIQYAAAASCLKHSIELDVNLSTVAEITTLMNGDGSGRVSR